MSEGYIYRTFHSVSSGQNSRNGFTAGQPVCLNCRNYEHVRRSLQEHFDLSNDNPTPWISTTDDLLRALTIAINFHDQGTSGVSIAVIDPDSCEPEPAEKLSRKYCLDDIDPVMRRTEFLCEGRIDKNAVVACSSFEQLVNRGLYDLVPEFDTSHEYWTTDEDDEDEDDEDEDEDDNQDEDEGEDDMDDDNNYVTEIPLATMRIAVQETRPPTGGRGYWTNVGTRAAKVARLFGVGAHTRPIAEEVVSWWVDEEDFDRRIGYIRKGINETIGNAR